MYDPLEYLGSIIRRINRTECPNWSQLNAHLDQYWNIADIRLGGTDPFITYSHDLNGLYYCVEGLRVRPNGVFFFQPPYEVPVERIPPAYRIPVLTQGQP